MLRVCMCVCCVLKLGPALVFVLCVCGEWRWRWLGGEGGETIGDEGQGMGLRVAGDVTGSFARHLQNQGIGIA